MALGSFKKTQELSTKLDPASCGTRLLAMPRWDRHPHDYGGSTCPFPNSSGASGDCLAAQRFATEFPAGRQRAVRTRHPKLPPLGTLGRLGESSARVKSPPSNHRKNKCERYQRNKAFCDNQFPAPRRPSATSSRGSGFLSSHSSPACLWAGSNTNQFEQLDSCQG